LEHAVLEAKEKITKLKNDSRTIAASPSISSTIRVLVTLQRDILGGVFGRAFLLEYINEVIDKFTSLLLAIVENHADLFDIYPPTRECYYDIHLKDSIIGVILRSIVPALCRKQYAQNAEFVQSVFPKLADLMSVIDTINTKLPTVKKSDEKYIQRLDRRKDQTFVIQTKHPYQQGRNQFKETVTIPGASSLTLRFDPQSRTASSSSDILQLFYASVDQPIYHEGTNDPVYFSGTSFPRNSFTIEGDTVTFVFNATSRPDAHKKNSPSRWGFRCTITEFSSASSFQAPVEHWSLDLENSLGVVFGRYTGTLIEGEAVSEQEKKYQEWLQSNLVRGGFEETEGKDDVQSSWLVQFVTDFTPESRGTHLHNWIKSHGNRRLWLLVQ
jgi:hypothetical protein